MLEWITHEVGRGTIVESAIVGFAQANCYILGCAARHTGAIIDPGTDTREERAGVVVEVGRLGVSICYIMNTHGHPDHFSGNDVLKRALGGEVCIHELDGLKLTDPVRNASRLFGLDIYVHPADHLLRDGEVLNIGDVTLTVLHVPGHSAGGVAFLGKGFVFTGDTLMAGAIGRTDLPCSSDENLIAYDVLLASIRDRLMTLPDDTIVLPGHGEVTTIGEERFANPFLR